MKKGLRNQERHCRPSGAKIAEWFYRIILVVTVLIIGWVLLLNLTQGINAPVWVILLIFIIGILGVILYRGQNYKKLLLRIRKKYPKLTTAKVLRISLIGAIVVGILARLAFILIAGRYHPPTELSDTGIQWFAAQTWANGESLNIYEGAYEAFFPHLMTYTATLAFFMKIFGASALAIIFSNLLFDLIAVFALYILLKKWRGKIAAHIGAILWLINPLEILYCGVGMAIVVTNTVLVIILLLAYLGWQSFQKMQRKAFLGLMIALGLMISLGNAFRPFFTVFIIALLMVFVYQLIRKKVQNIPLAIGGLALMLVSTFGGNQLIDLGYQQLNSYHVPGGTGVGWNFLVGANYETHGRYNVEDYQYWLPRMYGDNMDKFREFDEPSYSVIEVNDDLVGLQKELFARGLERYRQMNLMQLALHMMNKTVILFADATTVTWPFGEAYNIDLWNQYYLAIHSIGTILIIICLIFSLVFLLQNLEKKRAKTPAPDPYLLFVSLSFCGLTAASLMVEVMHRYMMPLMIFFMIFAACQIALMMKKGEKQHA